MTLLETITSASAKLSTAGIAAARLDAEVLLSHVLGKDRAWLFTHSHDMLDGRTAEAFEQAINRRAQREPLQYITGRQEFWGLEFSVTPDVLIPRPETELIVESALAIIADMDRPATIIDLCTGSGCIAISLAKEAAGARIIATDKSAQALAVARKNAGTHGVYDRIRFLEGDLFQPLEELDILGNVDILVSNPPYVKSSDYATLQPEVKDFEPVLALIAGPEGLDIHWRIIEKAPEFLARHGTLIMEMGLGQAEMLTRLVTESGTYDEPRLYKDLAGIERIIIARRN